MRQFAWIVWGLLAGAAVFAVFAIPLHMRDVETAKVGTCIQNVKLVGTALLAYAVDHDDRLPIAAVYPGALLGHPIPVYYPTRGERPLLQSNLLCPADPQQSMPGYAYNGAWAGASLATIPRRDVAVMLYEATGGELSFRHKRRLTGKPQWMSIGYCDGHVSVLTPEVFDMCDVVNKTASPIERWPPAP